MSSAHFRRERRNMLHNLIDKGPIQFVLPPLSSPLIICAFPEPGVQAATWKAVPGGL